MTANCPTRQQAFSACSRPCCRLQGRKGSRLFRPVGRAESQQTAEGIWLQPAQQASGLDRPGSRFFFRNQPGLPDKGGHFLDEGIGTAQLFERFPCPLLPQREQKCRQPGGHLRQAFGQGVDDGPGPLQTAGRFPA